MLGELGIADKMRWTETKMAYWYRGKCMPWGNPIALLRFMGWGLSPSFVTVFLLLFVPEEITGNLWIRSTPGTGCCDGWAPRPTKFSGAGSSSSSFITIRIIFPPHGYGAGSDAWDDPVTASFEKSLAILKMGPTLFCRRQRSILEPMVGKFAYSHRSAKCTFAITPFTRLRRRGS